MHLRGLFSSSISLLQHPFGSDLDPGTVTIFFLSHVFFLVSIVRHPYFRFAPSYEETNHYLLAFLSYSSAFILPL